MKNDTKQQSFIRNVKNYLLLIIYYTIAYYLPGSNFPIRIVGTFSKKIRYSVCKRIFKECGKNVNIERNADFGSGSDILIGDDSGLGTNCRIVGPIYIGSDVRMGPNVTIYRQNHIYNRTDISIGKQGYTSAKPLLICDSAWIGNGVIILPGCQIIGRAAVVGAGAVVTKDVPDYSIIGGNPAQVIRMRILTHNPIDEMKLTLPSGPLKTVQINNIRDLIKISSIF